MKISLMSLKITTVVGPTSIIHPTPLPISPRLNAVVLVRLEHALVLYVHKN